MSPTPSLQRYPGSEGLGASHPPTPQPDSGYTLGVPLNHASADSVSSLDSISEPPLLPTRLRSAIAARLDEASSSHHNSLGLTAPLPTTSSLSTAWPDIERSRDIASKVTWCVCVLSLVERARTRAGLRSDYGQNIDSQLQHLIDISVPLLLEIASPPNVPDPMPGHLAEAIYHRGTMKASGSFPKYISKDPPSAYVDFELSANSGHSAAWFKLGIHYEQRHDEKRALDCFQQGLALHDLNCIYRLGIAHLMGKLSLSDDPEKAITLLYQAATQATVEFPEPAYTYGLLLLSEYYPISIPPHLFKPHLPDNTSMEKEAWHHIGRAAYLNFVPALYKLGHAYQTTKVRYPLDSPRLIDPLISVHFYSLASELGSPEADMALSLWFLGGAEDCSIEKDEELGFKFAQHAAGMRWSPAEFAMGYFAEIGVGTQKDLEVAMKWYWRAARNGDVDALIRLSPVKQPLPLSLASPADTGDFVVTGNRLVLAHTAGLDAERVSGLAPTLDECHAVGVTLAYPRLLTNMKVDAPFAQSESMPLPSTSDATPRDCENDVDRGPSVQFDVGTLSNRSHNAPIDLSDNVVILQGPLRGGAACEIYVGNLSLDNGSVEKVAMKQLRAFLNWTDKQRATAMQLFRREVKIWSRFDHPHILPLLGFAQFGDCRFFLISPWVENGHVMEYLERKPDTDRRRLIIQVAEALEYLHSGRAGCAYVHGDLKGDNVLISDHGNALLCDFGLTRHVQRMASMTATPSGISPLGHIRFSAPELFKSDKPTMESDVFAFGCLALQIFTGHLPYSHLATDLQVLKAVSSGTKPCRPIDVASTQAGLTDNWWELINQCFNRRPPSRPKFTEILVRARKMDSSSESVSVSSVRLPSNLEKDLDFRSTPIGGQLMSRVVDLLSAH